MPSDLETNLILGGISPAAAKMISNAIANAASPRTNTGRQLEDSTPTKSMRMIDSNTRRYVLTNLDYPASKTSPSSKYDPKNQEHPYSNSQPASSSPTISTPLITAGKFVSVGSQTTNNVAQTSVTLRVASRGGAHARLNPSTGEIESVPFLVEVDPKNKVDATVEERPDATVIRLRFL